MNKVEAMYVCDLVVNQASPNKGAVLHQGRHHCQHSFSLTLLLQVTEYDQLSVHDRALILEALVTIVANTELLRNHLRHLEPEGATPVLNRGAVMGHDSAGNIYHHLGGASARYTASCHFSWHLVQTNHVHVCVCVHVRVRVCI